MGVACDYKRDYKFAQKNKLEIIPIIKGDKQYIACDSVHINSGIANGLNIFQVAKTIGIWLIKNKFEKKQDIIN